MTKEQLYYIQSVKRGYLGNSVIWWGKDCKGYTCHLNLAGKYTSSEVMEICKDPRDSKAYKIEDVEKAATLQVDMQYLKIGNRE